jgi:hypothetical protein
MPWIEKPQKKMNLKGMRLASGVGIGVGMAAVALLLAVVIALYAVQSG